MVEDAAVLDAGVVVRGVRSEASPGNEIVEGRTLCFGLKLKMHCELGTKGFEGKAAVGGGVTGQSLQDTWPRISSSRSAQVMGRARRLRPSHSEVVEDAEGEQLRVLESEHSLVGGQLSGLCCSLGAS